ncbi:MAG: hypothetical protein HQ536_04375 [Parcubacteria group bacterium]|nr:hypothetical protein [Parcubacteria group bacterium]
MKVEETGPYAHLKDDDFIIRERDTTQFQEDCRDDTNLFLETEFEAGRKVISGLKSLDVEGGKLHEILPG